MKNLLFFIGIIIVGASCENLLIKDLDIEETGFEKQLVIQSFIESGTDSVGVLVSENLSVLEEFNDIKYIQGADVRLFREGQEIALLAQAEDGFYKGTSNILLNASDDYELRVSNTPYDDARAVTRVPEEAALTNLEFVYDAGTDPLEMSEVSEISFDLDDPEGKNYYSISFEPISLGLDTIVFGEGDTIVEESFAYVYAPSTQLDPSVSSAQFLDEFLIDDATFDGQTRNIRLRVIFSRWSSSENFGKRLEKGLKFEITSHSVDSYNYLTSFNEYQSSRDFALFTEPVSVYTNIENGLGVFAGKSTKEYKLTE